LSVGILRHLQRPSGNEASQNNEDKTTRQESRHDKCSHPALAVLSVYGFGEVREGHNKRNHAKKQAEGGDGGDVVVFVKHL